MATIKRLLPNCSDSRDRRRTFPFSRWLLRKPAGFNIRTFRNSPAAIANSSCFGGSYPISPAGKTTGDVT